MKRIVIGTAGHIDHGKTTLIRALTGIDCDRLKEEKERGITTELGFAHYKFGDDLEAGIVDVPGHEKFVRHMVAGAWGIDMVLLVVAADEGVMPQTREHLDICEILGLRKGIVAITKKDLVDDDMLELVKEDIEDTLKGRALGGSPIVAVSSSTGENIDLLRELIVKAAMEIHDRSKEGIFRLPVDRVFTIRGLGTIITGTCISGSIRIGDEIEIYPTHTRAKVRNIQTYHEDAEQAMAGQRVALNLQGIERNEVERGTIIGRPDTLILTQRIDASLKYLKLPFKPIKNDSILRFHIATTQEEARLIVLTKDAIEPGEELFTQFAFREPIVTLPGDRFILRGSYAIQTIGGGTVLDIVPGRHKRKVAGLDETYVLLTSGTATDKAVYHILKGGHGGVKTEVLSILLGMDEASTNRMVEKLKSEGKARSVGRTIVHMEKFMEYAKLLVDLLAEFHARNPQKVGISKEELRTRLPGVDTQVFQAALDTCISKGKVEVEKDKVRIKGAEASANQDAEALKETLMTRLLKYGFTPPGLKELAVETGQKDGYLRDVLERLVYEGKVVKIKGDMYFHKDVIENLKSMVITYLKEKGEMTPSDFKSVLDLSRKYLIPLLEYLDEKKLTIRVGDKRVLRG
jgi:selenocysteine-specific elongation factor